MLELYRTISWLGKLTSGGPVEEISCEDSVSENGGASIGIIGGTYYRRRITTIVVCIRLHSTHYVHSEIPSRNGFLCIQSAHLQLDSGLLLFGAYFFLTFIPWGCGRVGAAWGVREGNSGNWRTLWFIHFDVLKVHLCFKNLIIS